MLMELFADMDAGSNPDTVVFPWIPTPSRVQRTLAGARLYRMINNVVNWRQSQNIRLDDPLQVLIDKNFGITDMTRVRTLHHPNAASFF